MSKWKFVKSYLSYPTMVYRLVHTYGYANSVFVYCKATQSICFMLSRKSEIAEGFKEYYSITDYFACIDTSLNWSSA
eukprot:6213938-Pleurochrysis_carterae.AAC.6